MAIKRPLQKPKQEPTASDTPPPRKRSSFAGAFAEAKAGGGFMAAGKHPAYIVEMALEGDIAGEDEDQGKLKVKVTYEGAEDADDEVVGKTISQWYSLCDDDGEIMGGVGFLKKDLDILGYQDVSLGDLEELLPQIASEHVKVIISVKQNGAYTNAYLQGLAEGE